MPSADQKRDAESTAAPLAYAITIIVPESFTEFVDAAITRLRYLFSSWDIVAVRGGICVSTRAAADRTLVQREVNYALYRERIRSEGQSLRELLLRSVMM